MRSIEDPRTVASLPGPPPRQQPGRSDATAAPLPVAPVAIEAGTSRPARTRFSGLLVSAFLHLSAIVGLSVLLGPLQIGRDEPMELDLIHAPQQLEDVAIALESALEEDLAAPRVEVLTALPDGDLVPTATPSVAAPLHGRGASGQRGSFFGTVAYGNRFTYVLDVSSSMRARRGKARRDTRLRSAVDELLYSVDNLTEDQFFYIVLFSDDTRQMFDAETLLPEMIPATPENKRRLREWLDGVRPGSGTDPRAALHMALRMRPSAVYLLSDGEFNGSKRNNQRGILRGNPSVEEVVAAYDEHQIPVHTIALEDRENRKRMEALAAQTGGEYRYVPPIKLPSVK